MSRVEVRCVGIDNLEDVIRILNASSRGHSFAYDLDVVRFLALARLWRVSYAHCFAAYCDGEPAGVVLNSVDAPSREAYSLYWGVLPAFRGHGVLSALHEKYVGQLRREGYSRIHGDAHPDSPWPVFEKLGWRTVGDYAGLETQAPVTQPPAGFEVKRLTAGELLALWPQPPGECRCWTQSAAFVRNAQRFLDISAAFHADAPQAYCVVTRWPGHTLLLDLRSKPGAAEAGQSLIAHLVENGFPAPYEAYMAENGSAFHRLLAAAGFVETRRITSVALDIAA